MASCRWVLDAAACVSVAVKDGRLCAAARSEGRTLLSERSKKNAKSRRQLGKKDSLLPGLKA